MSYPQLHPLLFALAATAALLLPVAGASGASDAPQAPPKHGSASAPAEEPPPPAEKPDGDVPPPPGPPSGAPVSGDITVQGGAGSVSATATTITYFGAAGSSTAELYLLEAPFRYRIIDYSGLVAGVGCSTISAITADCPAPNVTAITMYLQEGDDVSYIGYIHPVDSLTVYGEAGNDWLEASVGTLNSFGAMYVDSGAGASDGVYYDDFQRPSAQTYTATATAISRAGGTLSFANTEVARLSASEHNDIINTPALSAGQRLEVYSGAGFDTVNVGNGDLDNYPGTVQVFGNLNTTINIDDTASGASTYTLQDDSIDRAGFGELQFFNIAGLYLYGENGAGSTYNALSSPGSAVVIVYGGAGNDTFTFGADMGLIGYWLAFDGGTGTDTLTVSDTANVVGATYTMDDGSIHRGGPGVAFHDDMESVTFNASTGPSQLNADSSAVTTYINMGPQFDAVFPGGADLSALGGPLHIDMGAGNDYIQANDGQSPVAHTYTVTANQFDRDASAGFFHTGSEKVTLLNGTGFNTTSVTGVPTGVEYYLYGFSNTDNFTVGPDLGAMQGLLYIDGLGGTDTVTYNDQSASAGQTYEIRHANLIRTGAGEMIHANFQEGVIIGTTNHADTVYVMDTSQGQSLSLLTQGGNDTVRLFSAGLDTTGSASLDGGANTDALELYNGGLGSFFSGNTIVTPGRHNVTFSNFESTGTSAISADADGDGCPDEREIKHEVLVNSGGGRRPDDFWDWFDVTGDKAIDLSDALLILAHFGELPGDAGYSATFDRVAGLQPRLWRTRAATGTDIGIDVQDALANLQSFGHNCN